MQSPLLGLQSKCKIIACLITPIAQFLFGDHRMPKHIVRASLVGVFAVAGLLGLAPLRSADDANVEEITIYRDEFGIPNIYAPTEEGAIFGMGYAQAED